MKKCCPLCRCAAPAHEFGCWYLISPTPAAQIAADAPCATMTEVHFAHQLEAAELRRLATECDDPHIYRELLVRAQGHEQLSTNRKGSRP